jgi:hypothetical protein
MITRTLRSMPQLAIAAGALAIAFPSGASARTGVAEDFSQPVPASTQLREPTARSVRVAERHNGYGIEGRVLYRSAPAEAPRRFDLVGVAGEVHALEFRTRRDGGSWSDWVETDNGDPVYAGGADQVQIRSRGVPIEGHLHYVSVPPPDPAQRALTRSSGGLEGESKAMPEPKFISRAEWGANAKHGGCEPKVAPLIGKVKAGVVHHTVSTNTYTRAEAPGIVLGICRFHRFGNGWNDIGYNALVDRFGNLYEGRAGGLARPIVGAQAEGINSQTTGIASIGDNREMRVPTKERRAIVRFLSWKFDLAGISAEGRASLLSAGGESQRTPKGRRVTVPGVFSHNLTNFTECAGSALIAQVPQIRRAVQRRLDSYGSGSGTEPPPGTGGSAP